MSMNYADPRSMDQAVSTCGLDLDHSVGRRERNKRGVCEGLHYELGSGNVCSPAQELSLVLALP